VTASCIALILLLYTVDRVTF